MNRDRLYQWAGPINIVLLFFGWNECLLSTWYGYSAVGGSVASPMGNPDPVSTPAGVTAWCGPNAP